MAITPVFAAPLQREGRFKMHVNFGIFKFQCIGFLTNSFEQLLLPTLRRVCLEIANHSRLDAAMGVTTADKAAHAMRTGIFRSRRLWPVESFRFKKELRAVSGSKANNDVCTWPAFAGFASRTERGIILDKEPTGFFWMLAKPLFQRLANIAGNIRFFVWLVLYPVKSLTIAGGEKVVTVTTKSCPNRSFQLWGDERNGHCDFSPSSSISAMMASASFNACVRVQSISRGALKICTVSSPNTFKLRST